MKVAIITSVFPPEHTFSAQTSAQIAEELVCAGHAVHVYAPFPNRPKGEIFEGYKRTLYSTSHPPAGYTLTHCFNIFSRRSTVSSRFAENITFGISAGLRLLCSERPDVIYSNTWAIFSAGIIACVAKLRGVPCVISVQDVYPESLESQNRISRRNWVYRLLRWCDQKIAQSATELIVISQRFRQLYETDRQVHAEHLHVIPNWGSNKPFAEDHAAAFMFRENLGIPRDAFIAVYAGNIGVAANVEMLVDAFGKLREQSRMFLVIAGVGSQLQIVREKIEQLRLDHVVIHSPWKTEETQPVLHMADVLLLPTKGEQSLNSIPSKLISYFLAGRPVIAGVLQESDTGVTVLESGAGWVVQPDSVDQMAEALLAASRQSKGMLNDMGSRGLHYGLKNLSRESNLPRVIQLLETAGKRQR